MKFSAYGSSGTLIFAFVLALAAPSAAQSISLGAMDGEVWLHRKSVEGTVSANGGAAPSEGAVYVNDDVFAFTVEDGRFEATVVLDEGMNEIVACAGGVCSDTVTWTLRYELRPEVFAFATTAGGGGVTLHADVMENPNGPVTSFAWSADPDNPWSTSVTSSSDSVASVALASGTPHGEYYFDLTVTDSVGRQGHARTFVTVDEDGITPFDIETDHAAWVDSAVVYEVTPYIFERNGTWSDVTARLDEIARLGVNTLWIQPVFEAQQEGPGTSGQGYGITDYFELRSDLGSEADLRELVRSARDDYGMRVLFDFVPNHTSIDHRYAQHVLEYGEASPYYNLYLTEVDDAPYSQHYNTDREPFIYYFWDRLVTIDWSNPETYRWMMEAGRKWIEEFDIDGYRIDAVWGVDARTPEAMAQWRFDLKRGKPEIFLLGETPAALDSNFEARYDAAYDWYYELDWVSHWTWQTDYDENESHTIFNNWNQSALSTLLRTALTNHGQGFHPDAKVLRFMENNDTERFIAWHNLEQTKMAATLLFSLPGIPMIYNGQEIGAMSHPYETSGIFAEGRSIRSLDRYGLHDHYQYLAHLRTDVPALYGDAFDEVSLGPDAVDNHVFSYRRSRDGVHVIGVINMSDEDAVAELRLPLSRMRIDQSATYFVTDLLTGDVSTIEGDALSNLPHAIPGYTTHLFAISSEEIELPVASEPVDELPAAIELSQNYPNPFNPSTNIAVNLPSARRVSLRVYDMLGREVATLVDGTMPGGRHVVRFDAGGLATGIYVYRLDTGDRTLSRTMLLVR